MHWSKLDLDVTCHHEEAKLGNNTKFHLKEPQHEGLFAINDCELKSN